MQNPFFYGKTVEGSAFVNRTKEIKSLTSDLARGQSVILFSPRRFGKTSLIKQVISRLKKQKVLCFYIDLFPITSLNEFYTVYSSAIASNLKDPIKSLITTIQTLLSIISPKIVFSEPGVPSIEIDTKLSTLKQSKTLKQLFDCIEKYCDKNNSKACIIFDEFQEINIMENGEVLEKEMRSAFQHHKNVSYAFLGSKAHLMNELFKDKNRPFYNFGSKYELEAISGAAWQKHLSALFKKAEFTVNNQTINEINKISLGHPYYTQLLCSEIWEHCYLKKTITIKDVELAFNKSLDKENHAFSELWDTISLPQKKVLRILAAKPDITLFSNNTAQEFNLGAQSSIHRTVEQLLKRGILSKTKSKYSITDPFLIKWLQIRC